MSLRLALPVSPPEPSLCAYGICNLRIRDEMRTWG